jgi:hypothetical protein
VPSRFQSDLAEIVAVTAVWQIRSQPAQCLVVDVCHAIGNFLRAGDFQPLPLFDYLDKEARVQKRARRVSVEPSCASAECLNMEGLRAKVLQIQISDLEFVALGRTELARQGWSLFVVEIKTGDCVS